MPKEGWLEPADPLSARQFQIAVRRLADTLSYGNDRSPFLGSGHEYVQSRLYQPGDPIRALDWRVMARTGKPFVKEFEAPKRLPCYLLLDTSASMVVSSIQLSKYALAVQLCGGLAYACLERVSPVGFVGIGGKDFRSPLTLSKLQILQWLHRLRRYHFDEPTALGRRITDLAPTLTARSLIFVLSDLHDPDGLPALTLLAQKHDVAVFHLRDPAEQGMPGGGFLRAVEAETGKVFTTRAGKLWLDPETTRQSLRKSAIDYLLLPTDQPFLAKLRNFLRSRNLLGRAR